MNGGDGESEARKDIILHTTDVSPFFSIQSCQISGCRNIELPKDLLDFVNDGYSEITTEDLTLDGYPEVILTHSEEGSVNTCSKIYVHDRDTNKLHMSTLSHPICNYTIKKDSLISNYRSGAKWHEDIYRIIENDFILAISDSCIGCDHINRVVYLPDNKTEKLIVTDDIDYALRKPISTKIISDRAMLYKDPSTSTKTNMYLIKNDEVSLLDFMSTEDDPLYWYKIKYITRKGKIIKAWVACKDIEYCE
jgi:hypothetical protein